MIFLSLSAKTFALAVVHLHAGLAAVLWLAGAAADFRIARKSAVPLKSVLGLQAAALILGWAAVQAGDYAAMRWKDGIPFFAMLTGWLLDLCGLPAGSDNGSIFLTTMAGPLEFVASIDGLGLKVPWLCLSMTAVWLLWAEISLAEALRNLGGIAAILIVAALLRMTCIVLLANGLFDFVGYESDELPWRPFMEESAGIWIYLPILLAAAALGRRFLPAPSVREMPARVPRLALGIALAGLVLLAAVISWDAGGFRKDGRLVISSHHSQWSRSDRPYDRDWYGADSGYNYAVMKRLFEKFYQVADAPGPLTDADLAGASMLVIYDPDRRFSAEEIARVREFVRGGGGLLVIGDHTNVFGSTSHINELCEPFGFQLRDDVLFDLDEDFHQVIHAPAAAGRFWHGMSFFKLRGPTSIRPTSFWTRSVYEVGHSKSVRAIYSVNNFYPPPHDDPKMRTGTFCVAAASRYGSGRVAAWADSTVFSNFEIFYPGKYEYLLNTTHWLNHRDGMLQQIGRRLGPLVLLTGLAAFLIRWRDPRIWLAALTATAAVLATVGYAGKRIEHHNAGFPQPQQPSDWLYFAADPADPGHHLQDFISEEPYNQRYEVFIQWVLRTGAFAGFHQLGNGGGNGLQEHLRASNKVRVGLAHIVRKPEDLAEIEEVGAIKLRPGDPVLLMFSATIPPETATDAVRKAGIVRSDAALAGISAAWPAGEAVLNDNGRRVTIVAGAERFSDEAMGISEKVTPDATQRALFDTVFGIIDGVFGDK